MNQISSAKQAVLDKLWFGKDPFADIPAGLYAGDKQGWSSSTHSYLDQAASNRNVKIIVEVGVWKGRSVLHMARSLRDRQADAVIIAVDTWLGAWDHYTKERYRPDLKPVFGYPHLYYTFMQNIISENLQEYVVPLPLDSVNAANVLRHFGIYPDVIHIDAGHDFRSVTNDLNEWWGLLKDGGTLVGDDYGKWVEVRRAFDTFFSKIEGSSISSDENKCMILKEVR